MILRQFQVVGIRSAHIDNSCIVGTETEKDVQEGKIVV
jgi:hypothetical protein